MRALVEGRSNPSNSHDRKTSALVHTKSGCTLLALLVLGVFIVHYTGGTAYAYPYLMLIPVLLGAAWYGLYGGLIVAFVAGGLMALMPLNVEDNIFQSQTNITMRMGMYLLLGGLAGQLFRSRLQSRRERDATARRDPRTELPNNLALEEDLQVALYRKGAGQSLGLMLIRITDINDVLEAMGVDASDELVRAISGRIRCSVRGGVVVYRFSNAELALFIPNIEASDLQVVSDRLQEIGEQSLQVQQVPIRVQLVIGSSTAGGDETSPDLLISEARIALFAAIEKRLFHKPYSPALTRRSVQAIKLISRVRNALQENEFELHYQPKIRLSDDQVCGCEGLIRWRGSDGQLILPGMFMPKVETTTLIAPITRFVAQTASRFAARGAGAGIVSINLSVHNLYDEELLDLLRNLAGQLAGGSWQLEAEITESALIGDVAEASRAIRRIRDLGIGVSIDDFGTGYASFEYLRRLPISGLKIDRAFVMDLDNDKRARDLMKCMIDVGHALDLKVTAEGVETRDQHEHLRAMGCDQVQGFHFAPALPEAAYGAWCEDYANRMRDEARVWS